jgi:hypothetical protein
VPIAMRRRSEIENPTASFFPNVHIFIVPL